MDKCTHYDLLGVTPAAPAEIITAVYRAWMSTLRAHPDLGGDEEFAKQLNIAYATLRDPDRRAAYDAKISKGGGVAVEVTRRAPRTRVDAEIAYCAVPEDGWQKAKVIDVSALGLRVRTAKLLVVGDNIAIAFPGKIRHATEARVRWVRTYDDLREYRCEAGLEFFAPIPDILHKLGEKR